MRSSVPITVNASLKLGETSTSRGDDDRPGPDRSRPGRPHRRRSRPVREASAGERIVFAQFAGDARLTGHRRRLQRPLPRARRPRLQLLLHRRPAHHRPAEQGLLQPASLQLRPVARSHRRRATGRVRRQDQRRHRRHHPFRPGRRHAHRLSHHLLRHLRLCHRFRRPQLRQQELGQLHRTRRAQHRPLPRPARVRRLPRQRQRVQCL